VTRLAGNSTEAWHGVFGRARTTTDRDENGCAVAEGATGLWDRWLSMIGRIARAILSLTRTQWNLRVESGNTAEAQAFADFDRVFEMDGREVSGGRFCRVVKVNLEGRDYFVKRYHPHGEHFRKAFGRSWPVAEYRNLAYFQQMGIPVPRVVAYGSQRVLGLFRRGVIVTEGVPQAVDLKSFARARPEFFHDRIQVTRLLLLVADYVRRIHEDGFTHRDLKWRNLLVTLEETPQVFFLDCPRGGHRRRPWHEHRVIKDLATLDRLAVQYLSRTTRLRFYLAYRNQTRLTDGDKSFIARVLAYRGQKRRVSSSQRI